MSDEGGPEQARRRKDRSPSYPGINLETALERAEKLYTEERTNAAPVNTILDHWGYKPKSGGGMVALAALKKFGLLLDEGAGENRRARLSDLALRMIRDKRPDSRERQDLIRQAALTPPIHTELWSQIREHGWPSEASMEYDLVQGRGFTEGGAREFIQEFKSTIAYARLGEGDTIPERDGDNGDGDGDTGGGGLTPPAPPQAQAVQLPLGAGRWATLQAPFPFTEQDWGLMLAVLNAMKPGLVSEAAPSPPPEEEEPHQQETEG
jgi:hypothetical protein